jgi:cytochrome oxidase Cu insertion factor (SCO1/SenC/PrrC family)
VFSLQIDAFAQLANGTVAPDFTLTDYYGTTHQLYSYLNSGKTVFLEIFAAHCPSCWNYHQTHTMKNMYNLYGPNGTNEVMVLALEYDQWNDSNAFIGNGPAWVTQGNWLSGTPFPIFDVEDPFRGVFTDYDVSFYPVVYKICPNKIVERVFTSETEAQLYQKVEDCLTALAVNELEETENIYINQYAKSLIIERFHKVSAVKIINLQGQVVKSIGSLSNASIGIGELKTGLYLVEINYTSATVFKKLYLN